jgi:outer membrane protein OmpA-like peptidoglycan-associated protein
MGGALLAVIWTLFIVFGGERVGNELVVVLPGPGGKVGTVIVQRKGERVVLNQAYAASRIVDGSAPQAQRLSAAEVGSSAFGAALSALPERPKSFLVYFLGDSDELTPESRVAFAQILAELRGRSFPDVVVIGHSDRLASEEYNDRLSLQRAERVREELLKLGIAPGRIRTAGRGERELLVPTADGVAEPRNRRVEINVR